MDLKEPHNSDKINEISEENVFDAEEYPGWTNDKKVGFISKLFSKPLMPFGLIGFLLLILIVLFVVFMPKNHKTENNQAIKTIEDRLNVLEQKLAKFEELDLQVKQLDEQSKELESALNQFNERETSFSSRIDQLSANLSDLKEIKTKANLNKTKALKSSKDASKSSKVDYHQVRSGENLFRISLRYGLTVNELRRLNKLGPNAVIQPGQKLIISRP